MSECPIKRENELWTHSMWYDDKCKGCKEIVQIGKRKFCGVTPARCGLHQIIRSQIGCIGCEHYTKNLDCKTCLSCLEEHPQVPPFEMKSTIDKQGVEQIHEG